MYIHTHTRTRTYTHTHTHIYIYIYIYIYIRHNDITNKKHRTSNKYHKYPRIINTNTRKLTSFRKNKIVLLFSRMERFFKKEM